MPVYLPGLTFGGLGYGGASYGYSPYGSGVYPRLPVPTTGGYGGAPYGYSSYGSVDITPPRVTGANALDAYRVEVFFSEEMAANAALIDPTSYVFTSTYGVPLTTTLGAGGTAGGHGGFTSVIVTHTGSTLGGQYTVTVTGPTDLAGNPVGPPPTNVAAFYALGDSVTVDVQLAPDDGRTVRLEFLNSLGPQDILTESAFSPGVEDTSSYQITTTYPVAPTLSSPTQDSADHSRVTLDVHPMTSAEYTLTLGPSLVYSYEGKLLPDDDPNLNGTEIGTGTSVATVANGLLLSKASGVQYGWSLGDTTGRLLPGSSYQTTFSFTLASATIIPAVFNTSLVTFSVSDGAVQIDLTLSDVSGAKVIDISSGAYTARVAAAWGAGIHEVTLIRNQMGDFYTVLFDGVPLNTFSSTTPGLGPNLYPAGSAVVLSAAHEVKTFKLLGVESSASSTLFTDAWNFIHGLSSVFTGSAVLTRDRLTTKYGPLVRGWGDATPATKQDVEVRLDGGAITLAGVNPYVGEIYPALPIPLATAGTFTVETDYIWFMTPAMEMAGLNTRGLTLNTWDRSVGHTAGALSPTPPGSSGAAKTNRFPMGVTLAPYNRPSPKQIGHRYIGWQKDYSALLNQPTTLLLNQNPHAVSIGGLSADSLQSTGTFDGKTTPQDAPTPWILSGTDTGIIVGDGTYRLIDASSGPYGVGTAAIYERALDLSLSIAITDIVRFKVESYTADGVFTGVGIGLHDGEHLFVAGALVVDGVQHVGVLTDATKTHLEEGWEIGPKADATGTSSTTFAIDIDDLPSGVAAGGRLRIASGVQAGVYTIAACGLNLIDQTSVPRCSCHGGTGPGGSEGDVEITLEESFPESIETLTGGLFTVFFETLWDTDLISFRVYSEFPAGSAQVHLGGAISGLVADLSEVAPYPAQTALLLPATEKGIAFWGSLSRRASSNSIWDLTQYTANPERMTQTVEGISVYTEMGTVPQDDPNDPWYIIGGFGYSQVDASGDQLLLKSTSGSPAIDLEFSYERVEPFLTPRVTADTEATFRVDSGILGAGDATLRVRDTEREAVLKTLLYVKSDSGHQLVPERPSVSLSGLRSPDAAGWAADSGNTISDPVVRGQTLLFDKASASRTGFWSNSADQDTVAADEGVIIEGRFSVESHASGSFGIGIGITGHVYVGPGQERAATIALGTNSVLLLDRSGNTVATFLFTWDDGEVHTYRLLCDPVADIAILMVDDTLLGSTPFSDFPTSVLSPDTLYLKGVLVFQGTGTCACTLHSMSVVPLRTVAKAVIGPPETIHRTFGVLLYGKDDPDDIDSYRIPRSDVFKTASNSSLVASIIEMDWQSLCRVRMYLDPCWGLSVYRPDLALPPTATEDFATETTDPSAAWINVEYGDLPLYASTRGNIAFGAIDSRAITQQRWDSVRYRVRGAADGFGLAPQGMVLNRAFTLTSGEFNQDVTLEVVQVTSRTPFSVYLSDSAMYADRVYVVQVDGSVVPSSDWSFDEDTQHLHFTIEAKLPSYRHPVTVTFVPGKPVTKTYLCSQPIEASVTLLNEDTPPVPTGRDEPTTREILAGSRINDPHDVLDDAESLILNDPLRLVKFTDEDDALYADLQFCEVEDGESIHITTLCDSPGPGHGLTALKVEGDFTADTHTIEGGPVGPWGQQSPVIKGSATHFDQSTVLMASGGVILGGTLGPGTAVLYPNQRGPSGLPPEGGMGINQDFTLRLSVQALVTDATVEPVVEEALEEDFSIDTTMGDNVPPSNADPSTDPNPDGVPPAPDPAPQFEHGACAYTMVNYATVDVSRLGPWGGLSSLTDRSLLAGGAQLNGTEFLLVGGAQLPTTTTVTGGFVTWPRVLP